MMKSKISKKKKTMLILGSGAGILVFFLIAADEIYIKKGETLLYKIQRYLMVQPPDGSGTTKVFRTTQPQNNYAN